MLKVANKKIYWPSGWCNFALWQKYVVFLSSLRGKIQNKYVFKPSLNYLDWSNKSWNAAQCAKEVKRAYDIEHGGYDIEHDV